MTDTAPIALFNKQGFPPPEEYRKRKVALISGSWRASLYASRALLNAFPRHHRPGWLLLVSDAVATSDGRVRA